MKYVSYTVYQSHFDPAPGRGRKPAQVGMTIKQTPNLTIEELRELIRELQQVELDLKYNG